MSVNKKRQRVWSGVFVAMLVLLTARWYQGAPAAHAGAAASGDWPTYLFNNARGGFNAAETMITPKTAPNLKEDWSYKDTAASSISAQPVEANGMIYWGSWNDGVEHALDLTGHQVWGTSVGVSPPANCSNRTLGVASTATIASERIGGITKSVLYVGGGDVNLYALDALTGAQIWKTPLGTLPDYYIWSSPAVYKGSVYIGVSSRADCPLVQGELVQLDAATGQLLHTFDVVPTGCTGGSIWSSPTIDTQAGTVYVATGNPGPCSQSEPYAVALVELRASDLSVLGYWQVPVNQQGGDSDFGSTPTLFKGTIGGTVTNLVGVANKNGIFYTFAREAVSNGPVWMTTLAIGGGNPQGGKGSISPAAWDGTTLYAAGGNTTINGQSCKGSLRAIDPSTGSFKWQDCFTDGIVLAAVSLVPGVAFAEEGSHVVAVATRSGKKLFDFDTLKVIYGAASISNGVVYVGSTNAKLYAFGL